MKFITVSGHAGSGKTYICNNYFYKKYNYYPLSLADSIKMKAIQDKLITFEEAYITKPVFARKILQDAGTIPRELNENIWCDILLSQMRLIEYKWGISNFCCDDIRFRSEVKWVKNLGGVCFRIEAPTREAINGLTEEARNHISETSLDNVNFDEYFDGGINNNIEEADTLDYQIQQLMKLV